MHSFRIVDWTILGCYLIVILTVSLSMRRYVEKAEHFIVAGRRMNVYLGIASLSATEFGIVTAMYAAELGYTNGFAGVTPGILLALAMLLVGLSGFVITPLRNSGAMTIPELLDRKFGPRVRFYTALIIVLGGLLNMGIFLRLGGEFITLMTGIGTQHVVLVMFTLLLVVLLYTAVGGMVSVLVADYLQFLTVGAGLVIITALVMHQTGWNHIMAVMEHKTGAGGFSPFLSQNMGVTYVVWQGLNALAIVVTWQTMIQRVLSARDSATARRIYTRTSFYFVGRFLIPAFWGMGALVALGASGPHNSLHALPIYLASMLPPGVLGLVLASMLAAEMSTNSGYLLTWSTVIYNDIICPLRRDPFSEAAGLLANRITVVCIGAFLLAYGIWYKIPGSAWDYLSITANIYLSSTFVLLVSCCYWKRASRVGAVLTIAGGALSPIVFLISGAAAMVHVAGLASFALAAAGMIAGSCAWPDRNAVAEGASTCPHIHSGSF